MCSRSIPTTAKRIMLWPNTMTETASRSWPPSIAHRGSQTRLLHKLMYVISLFRALFGRICRRPGLTACALALLALIGVGAYLGWLQLSAWSHFRAAQEALKRRDFSHAR